MKVKVVRPFKYEGEEYEEGEVADLTPYGAHDAVAKDLAEWGEKMVLVTNETEGELGYEGTEPGDPMWVTPSFARTSLEDGSANKVRDPDGNVVSNRTHDLKEPLDSIHIQDGVAYDVLTKDRGRPEGERGDRRAEMAASGLEVGDEVLVTDGPLEGLDARIVGLDERGGRATLDTDPPAPLKADKLKLIEEGGTPPAEAPAWEDIERLPDRVPVRFLRWYGGHEEGDEVKLPEEYARKVIKKGAAEIMEGFGDRVRRTVFPSGHVERGRLGKVLVKRGPDQPQLRYRGRNRGVDASVWIPLDEAWEREEEGKFEVVRDWGEVEHYFQWVSNSEKPPERLPDAIGRRDITPHTPPAQAYYVLRRLHEQRRVDRIQEIGDPEKYGDWRIFDEDRVREMAGIKRLRRSAIERLPFVDQIALALARSEKFRQGPTFIRRGSKPELLDHATRTPGDSVALGLLEKHELKPAQLRLLTMMMTSYRPDRDDRRLRREDGITFDWFDIYFEDFIGVELPHNHYDLYLKELKPLQRGKRGKRLARFYKVNGEKYDAIGRAGAFLLTADFPPWDRAGPIHRRKAANGKLCCEQMGCFALATWHGMREVARHLIPGDRTPDDHARYVPEKMDSDLAIIRPDEPRDPFRPGWDEDEILHGETFRKVTKDPERVKTALSKNVKMGRRTVFFVASWEEALIVREKALEFLEENGLPEVIRVGMEWIPDDCLVIIQPIDSPTPTESEKLRLKEEEVVREAGEVLLAGGKISPNKVKGGIYVRVKGPGDERYHSIGRVSEDAWSELEEWREYGTSEYELNRIRKWWPGRMRMAIDIELEKDRGERNIRIDEGEGLIKIGKHFTFELTDESWEFLNGLLHEE